MVLPLESKFILIYLGKKNLIGKELIMKRSVWGKKYSTFKKENVQARVHEDNQSK